MRAVDWRPTCVGGSPVLDPFPWWVWLIRVRIFLARWGSIGASVAGVLLVVWIAQAPPDRRLGSLLDPLKADFRASTGVEPAREPPLRSEWEVVRDQLAAAHQHRREGRTKDALLGYATVMEAPFARTSDRQSAQAWSARLRLAEGERSALADLQRLASQRLEPRLYAHVAASAMQYVSPGSAKDFDASVNVEKRAIVSAATRQLMHASRVRGESGERARRWLDRVLARSATFFSP